MSYNPDIHHRRSIRLKNYDYTQANAYFITICTKNRQCIFGDVKNGEMRLNALGAIAFRAWQEIPQHFPHIILDQFIIMPNHIHGLVWIKDNADIQPKKREFGQIVAGSISALIRSYKSAVTKQINQITGQKGTSLVWQRGFYEKINRNEQSLQNIREYIINNPLKWHEDPENPSLNRIKSKILLDLPF